MTIFSLPSSKRIGDGIPDLPDDCAHFRCSGCGFVFNDVLSNGDIQALYREEYWQEHASLSRVSPMLCMRLLMLASGLLGKPLENAEILDFGCGQGRFVEEARRELGLRVWGTDINPPPFGREYFVPDLGNRRFDVIVATEVIEHLPQPRATFESIFDHLSPGGVFAFQTTYWNDQVCDRDWWYLGPAHGHVSFYSAGSLEWLAKHLGVSRRVMWADYPGIQAWAKGEGASKAWYARFIETAELWVRNGAAREGRWIVDQGTGDVGTIVYGPYWPLDPGRYRVSIAGDVVGTYRLAVTAGGGRAALATAEISAGSPSVDFVVPDGCADFECVIRRGRASRGLRLERVLLHRLGDAGTPQPASWRRWLKRD